LPGLGTERLAVERPELPTKNVAQIPPPSDPGTEASPLSDCRSLHFSDLFELPLRG
jgi:hypothetical protein